MATRKSAKRRKRAKRAPGKAGRPPHKPTDHLRSAVRYLMIAHGEHQENVAKALNIAPMTLRKHYRHELDTAKGEIDAAAVQTLILCMLGGPERRWQDADRALLQFYARTRMGWGEPKQEHHHSGAVGTFDYSKLTDEQALALEEILTAAAVASGPEGGSGSPAA